MISISISIKKHIIVCCLTVTTVPSTSCTNTKPNLDMYLHNSFAATSNCIVPIVLSIHSPSTQIFTDSHCVLMPQLYTICRWHGLITYLKHSYDNYSTEIVLWASFSPHYTCTGLCIASYCIMQVFFIYWLSMLHLYLVWSRHFIWCHCVYMAWHCVL